MVALGVSGALCFYSAKTRIFMKVTKEDIDFLKPLILDLHNIIIEASGGEKGVRDDGGLEHAIDRMLSVDDKKKNALTLAAKTYLLFATRHYFTDGNKRTAHIVAKILLILFGRIHLKVHYKDAVKFIMDIAAGKKSSEEIIEWIKDNSDEIPDGTDIQKHFADCDEDIKEMQEFMKQNRL
jgi:death-on-curing protein